MIVLEIIGWLLLGVLGLIAFFLLLCCFSVRVHASYLRGEAAVSLRFLFLRFRLYPAREKPEKPKKARKQKPQEEKPPDKPAPEKEKRPWRETLEQYRPLLRTAKAALRRLCKHLVIYRVEAGVDVAGADAHKTALAYAKTAALVSVLAQLLGELFTFRRKYIRISPDFLGEKTRINIALRIRIRPIFALIAGARLFFAYLSAKPPKKEKDKQEGGQQYESAASHR